MQYKLSDSSMSLLFIFYIIFMIIEGHGPIKSLGRRLVVTVIVLVTALPQDWRPEFIPNLFYIPLFGWALLFPLIDAYSFNV